MPPQQTRALLALCLMAAFADQRKDDKEREHIKRVAASLGGDSGVDLLALYQDVLLRRITLEDAVGALDAPELRHLAYEMAVGVCDADGVHDAQEAAFLERLRTALTLPQQQAATILDDADQLAAAPPSAPLPAELEQPAAAGGEVKSAVDTTELDKRILNAAILNGALELLPQSLASMAIIPLQTRLVYRIGEAYGYSLDKGHIADFLATIGVGLTSQYVEQFGRKLVGGLLGKVLGKTGRAIGSAATGSAFSFATTYALGQVAKHYYGGGRKLDGSALKTSFNNLLGQARDLQQRYTPEIEQRARTLDVGKLMAELKA